MNTAINVPADHGTRLARAAVGLALAAGPGFGWADAAELLGKGDGTEELHARLVAGGICSLSANAPIPAL